MYETTQSTSGSREHAKAVALSFRLAAITANDVPMVIRDRVPRLERAKLTRQLFKRLGLHGISVRTPRYSMAHTVDLRLPRTHDGPLPREAQQRLLTILVWAFPDYIDRSDMQSDYFDFHWSID